MEQDNRSKNPGSVFSKTIRAGKRRTYFFDVRTTRSNDYYITITESKKRFNDDGYDRHKVFLYKEDFNKFLDAMTETIDHVKTELLPEYDFDEFSKNTNDDDTYDFSNDIEDTAAVDSSKNNTEAKSDSESGDAEDSGVGSSENDATSEEDLKW